MPYHLTQSLQQSAIPARCRVIQCQDTSPADNLPTRVVAGRFEEASMMSDDRTESSCLTVLPLLDWSRWRQYGIDYIIEVAS